MNGKFDPHAPTVNNVLEFFHYGVCSAHKAFTSKYLTGIVSTLKWVVDPSHHHILDHVYVKRYIAGYFNTHPPPPKPPRTTWDIQHVLDYWAQQPDNHALDLLQLGKKTAMLFLLSTCRRKNELLMLSTDHMYFFPQRITFVLTGLPKTCTHKSTAKDARYFTVKQFAHSGNRKLCPVRALATYLLKTKNVRSTDKLFITSTPPFSEVKPMTLNRWITSSMKDAGVDVSQYTPYTTRHASASKALQRGIPLDEIMRMGTWTLPSTFIKHYNLPIMQNSLTASTDQGENNNQASELNRIGTMGRYIPRIANRKHYVKIAAKIARTRTKRQIK